MLRTIIVHDLDAKILEELFQAVGAHLEVQAETASVLVVGGAALSLHGWVRRTTLDVDVLALAEPRGEVAHLEKPDFSGALQRAVARVARDFHLPEGWFNAEVGAQWQLGLPNCARKGIEWRLFGGLRIGLASRQTLITLKLYAAADLGPISVHVQDLVALEPDDAEFREAEEWVVQQDKAPEFSQFVSEVVAHVRERRADR